MPPLFGGPGGWERDTAHGPVGTVTAQDSHSLILAYRCGDRARPASDPMPTMTTVGPAVLIHTDVAVEDGGFRMLEPVEIARAMVMDRRPNGQAYIVHGTRRDQVKQYGNAVTPPVTHRILDRVEHAVEAA